MKSVKRAIAVFFAVLSFGIAGGAGAVPSVLLPGGTNFNGVALFEQPGFTGAPAIVTSLTTPFAAAGEFSGDLVAWVISGDTNNPLGGLDFVYQFSNNFGGTPAGIHRLTVTGFAGLFTGVGFDNIAPTADLPGGAPGAGNLNPTSVDRSVSGGNTVGWNFLPSPQCGPTGCFATPGQLTPGPAPGFPNWTSLLVVYTNATVWGTGGASLIDGSSVNITTLTPIPEPETYAMMLAGLGLMVFVARRRRGRNTAA